MRSTSEPEPGTDVAGVFAARLGALARAPLPASIAHEAQRALLDLDGAALARALRLAATMTLGHREAFGTMTKAFHPGKAAANGILAARLAALGADAPASIVEDPRGFAAALSTRFDPAQLLDD